jgi:hypothetical protein
MMKHSKSPTPPSDERRPKRRSRVLLGGLISYGGGTHNFICTIRNITDTGARIAVRGRKVPADFHLINLRDRIAYDAVVIWFSDKEVGVKFRNTFRLSEISDPALGYLRDLWLAQATR